MNKIIMLERRPSPDQVKGIDFEELFKYYTTALVVCDPDLGIIGANESFMELFQLGEKEITGHDLSELWELDSIEIEKLDFRVETLIDSGKPFEDVELRYTFPKIGYRILTLRILKIGMGGQDEEPTVLISIDDRTSSASVDKKIREVKGDLQVILDGITDGIAIIDRDWNIQRLNHGLLDNLGGADYVDILGRKCYEILYDRNDPCDDCPARSTFATAGVSQTIHTVKVDNSPMIFEVKTFPLVDADGNVQRVVLYFHAITDRVVLERKIIESEREHAAMALASGVVQTLKNPLSVIRSASQLCVDESGKSATREEMLESLTLIISKVDSATCVLNELLKYSRPAVLNLQPEDVNDMICEVLSSMEERISQKGIRLLQDLDGDLSHVRVDKEALTPPLLSILENAIDAMEGEGGSLTVATRRGTGDESISISISDTGKGLSEDELGKIFEPFYSTRARMGLGLTLSRKIIRLHGGTLTAESDGRSGTKITIHLPV